MMCAVQYGRYRTHILPHIYALLLSGPWLSNNSSSDLLKTPIQFNNRIRLILTIHISFLSHLSPLALSPTCSPPLANEAPDFFFLPRVRG